MPLRKHLSECKSAPSQILWKRKQREIGGPYVESQNKSAKKWRKANRERFLKARRELYIKNKVKKIMAEMAATKVNKDG